VPRPRTCRRSSWSASCPRCWRSAISTVRVSGRAGPCRVCWRGRCSSAGAALVLPVAIWRHGLHSLSLLAGPALLATTLVAILSFSLQYVAFFRLQQIAGPVYLSQIGSVAALLGALVAIVVLGEHMQAGFAGAAVLIVTGIAIFQYSSNRHA